MPLFRDAGAGHIQREQHPTLDVGGGLRGVHVLAWLVGGHGAAGEGQRSASLVANRDQDPLREEVLAVRAHQARRRRVGQLLAALLEKGHEIGAAGRVAQAEAAGQLLVDVASSQQPAAWLAGRRRPEDVLVVLLGQPVHLQDPAAQRRALALGARLLLALDPGQLGQAVQRTFEIGLLDQLLEADDVAAPLAAEAVPGLHLLVNPEAGRLLLVEGTEAGVLAALLAQADVLLDEVEEVESRLDLVDEVVRIPAPRHAAAIVCPPCERRWRAACW